MSEEIEKIEKSLWDKLETKITDFLDKFTPKPVNMVLKCSEGSLTIDTTSDPKVGDKASPDGTFTEDDGTIITVKDGLIESIIAPAAELTPDQVALNEANQKIVDLTTEKETLQAEITALNLFKTEATDLMTTLKEAQSKFKVPAKDQSFNKDTNVQKTTAEDIKAAYKKHKETK